MSETAESDTSWWRFDGTWARSNLGDAHSGDWSFAASPGNLYPAGILTALSLAQPLSLPPGTQVQLQYWQRLDVAGGDSAQVQVSTDNANWVTVVSETAVRNPAWTVRTVRLDAYAGQALWLRFVLSADADPATVGDGWWLDDITVRADPLSAMSRPGLSVHDGDDLSLWFAEGSWQAVGGPVHSGGLAWTAAPQPNTATALTLNVDISLDGMNAPELRFWHKLNLASGEDRAQVELSTDGGQTWQPIVLYPGTTTAGDWNEQITSLAAYAGQTLRVRFLLIVRPNELQSTNWTIDSITIQSGTGQPPAISAITDTPVPVTSTGTATATLSQAPEDAGWTTYADTDSMLHYGKGDWQTFAVAAAAGGTLTGTADQGATLTLQFEGTGARLIYSKGPEGRLFTGQVDGAAQMADSYAETYSYGHVIVFENLLDGIHQLIVTNGEGAIWIEAVEVQGHLVAPLTGVFTPTPEPAYQSSETALPLPEQLTQEEYVETATDTSELIAAINAANSRPGSTTTIYLTSSEPYLVTQQFPRIREHIIIRGTQPITLYDPTATDGTTLQGSNMVVAMFYVSGGGFLELHHVRIQNGRSNTYAGAIDNYGTLAIYDSVLMDNSAFNGAGAVFNGSAHSVQLERTAWLRNSAGGGGAIQNYGSLSAHCTLFQSNGARYGGALLNDRGGTITVTASKFVSNAATADPPEEWGGDIYNLSGTVTATGNEWVDGPKVNHAEGAPPVDTASPQPFDASDACAPLAPEPPLDDDCSDNTLDVIPESLFQERGLTQEAEDMKAVASLAGLYLHEGPTLNARRLGILVPWGSNVTVQNRMTFAQTAFPDQVWYSIQYGGQSGWIAARIEDKYYLEGVDADSDACSQLDAPSTLTFSYDRRSAAEYAIAHSYRNSVPSTQSGQMYPGASRVTNRLDPGITIDGQSIPFANEVKFADFTNWLTGDPGSTGSALFISEAVWMGGLPMTYNVDTQGNTDPLSRCQDSASLDLNIAGWRYCDEESSGTGVSTRVWRTHQGITIYYSRDASIGENNVIAQHGQRKAVFVLFTDGAIRSDFAELAGNLQTLGAPQLDQNQQAFFDRYINPNTQNQYTIQGITSVRPGDYIFINRQTVNGHGLLIAGWGAVMSCPSALSKVWTFSPSALAEQGQLFQTFGDAEGAAVVPYVVDFPGPIDPPGNQLQLPRARPFYCSQYRNPGFFSLEDDWAFYTFPSTVTIPVDRLYISANWQWEE